MLPLGIGGPSSSVCCSRPLISTRERWLHLATSYKHNGAISRDFQRHDYFFTSLHTYDSLWLSSLQNLLFFHYSHVSKCHHTPPTWSSQKHRSHPRFFPSLHPFTSNPSVNLSTLLSKYILSLSTPLQFQYHGTHSKFQGLSPGHLKKPYNLSPCFHSTIR